MLAKYKRNQHVEARNFIDNFPAWLPAVIRRALSGRSYSVVMRYPDGYEVTVARQVDEIRPLQGDGDG